MPSRPVFAFALAATTLLVVGVGSARADAGAASAPESTAVIEPPADPAQTTLATTGGAAGQTGGGGSATVGNTGGATGGSGTGATTGGGTQQVTPTSTPTATQTTDMAGAGTTSSTTEIAPADPTGTAAAQTPEAPAEQAPAEQAPAEPARPAPSPDASLPAPHQSSFVEVPPSPPAAVGAPPAVPARSAPAAARPGTILEQLLPNVERRLQGVQAQIGHMRQRLAQGAAPPSRDLARLRLSLHLIGPALLALQARIGAAGPLSPDLRHLLQGVHGRLADTRASAAALAAALRRAGVDTPEAQRLVRELEAFSAAVATPPTPTQVNPGTPWSAPDVARVYAPSAPAPSRGERVQARRPSGGEPSASLQSHAPTQTAPAASSAGSASAGSGGGLSGAGVAALAALLFGLALPQLLSRLQLPTAPGYAAGFLTPLERPG